MSREYTAKLLDMAEEGAISWETVARESLEYMSEDMVKDMVLTNYWVEEDNNDNPKEMM